MRDKYPYIPDKNMYSAVLCACSYIREKGYFHKAVEYAADKYNVPILELERQIRARQSVGQKGKAKGRKYRYYLSQEYYYSDAEDIDYGDIAIIRATSYEKAQLHFSASDIHDTMRNDYGGNYAPSYHHRIVGDKNGYETKKEAQEALNNLSQEVYHD